MQTTNVSVRTDGSSVTMDIKGACRSTSLTMTPQAASALALRLTDVACIAKLIGNTRDAASDGKARK